MTVRLHTNIRCKQACSTEGQHQRPRNPPRQHIGAQIAQTPGMYHNARPRLAAQATAGRPHRRRTVLASSLLSRPLRRQHSLRCTMHHVPSYETGRCACWQHQDALSLRGDGAYRWSSSVAAAPARGSRGGPAGARGRRRRAAGLYAARRVRQLYSCKNVGLVDQTSQ